MPSGKTEKKRVVAVGIFDLLHPGHIHYLKEAKKLGGELWVLVTRDEIARREKRSPILSEKMRVFMLQQLSMVDKVLLWSEEGVDATFKKVKPDVLALGYDQPYVPKKLEKEFSEHGLYMRVTRIGR